MLFLLQVGQVVPVNAAETSGSAWSVNEQGRVRLISAVTAVGDSDVLQMGVEFDLKPGWKIYWRSPGDAGYPPSIDWQGSDNLADAVLQWPAPRRFSIQGLETMGYEDQVVLPLTVRLNESGKKLGIKAAIDYLTCSVVCVPQHVDVHFAVPAGPAMISAEEHLISRFLAHVPGDGKRAGLTLHSVNRTQDGQLRVVVQSDVALRTPDLFIEQDGPIQFGRPRVSFENERKRVVFTVAMANVPADGDVGDKPLTLTMVDGERSMEAVNPVGPPESGLHIGELAGMVVAALLGGLILNVMPCVLPVLSLKVLSVIRHGGDEPRALRGGFLASAAGIMASFLVLALVTCLLKAVGLAVGWGLQFQQPGFLIVMTLIVAVFAANLFGLFEIGLPRWAADWAVEWGGSKSNGLVGNFAAGAFATLLATPCSAPFLGTAVGFALAHGPFEIMLIFCMLGLGMSTPYLLLAVWPGLAAALPRPGRWMVTVRRALGAVLLATAGWLLFVLYSLSVPTTTASATTVTAKGLWKPFAPAEIAGQVAAGKIVFVDVTAGWCITCQVNKAAVIYRGDVIKRLSAPAVVAMQGDWTKPDDSIGAYLAGFGRYGIPFDAVYGPGAPNGIPLPELLTPDVVLDALNKAAARS